jgi:hypothetical protein
MRSLQIGCTLPALAASRGAVAYNPTVLAATISGGAVPAQYAEQYRRTTTGAVVGMGGPSLATLTASATSTLPATFECGGPAPTSSTTSTAPTTRVPTTTAAPTTTSTPSSTAPVDVLAASQSSATGSSDTSSNASSSAGASALAATGGRVGRPIAWSVILLAVGAALLVVRRERVGR